MPGNERDSLRNLDWSKVYGELPDEVSDGARVAFLRIRQREQRRRRAARTLRWAACAAACLALIAGASALLLRERGGAPDQVVPLSPGVRKLRAGDEVYATRADGCFHVRANCPSAGGEPVAMKLITALEFGKELCPDCGANCEIEG